MYIARVLGHARLDAYSRTHICAKNVLVLFSARVGVDDD